MEQIKKAGPLQGLKVVDFTIALAGVYISWQLADMGAEVWKIERKGAGDQARTWDPFINGLSTLYTAYNKNKQSIELDLRAAAGKQAVFDMVKEADIVLENFKSGSIDRLGLGYDVLRQINPRIVFVSLSGFGGSGPLLKYPCYDAIAAARGGFAATNGEPDGAPMKAGNANCDTLTGTHALNAALMGVIQARRTGQGCHIDIGMTDTVMVACGETLLDYTRGQYQQARFGNHDRFTAPYGLFETRDGWAAIIADTEPRWQAVCSVLGRPEWAADPRFATNADRIAHRDELVQAMEAETVRWKRSDLEKALLAAGVPASEVLPFIEAYTSDHANATGCTQWVDQPKIGLMRFYTNPLQFDDQPCPIHCGAPLLGQDSRQVLESIGYTAEQIDQLYADGVVASSMF